MGSELFELKCWLRRISHHSPQAQGCAHYLAETASYSREQLKVLHNQQLQKTIDYCYREIPYYTDLFRQLRLQPDDIRTGEDLKKLPCLDRSTVQDNYDKLLARKLTTFQAKAVISRGKASPPIKFLHGYASNNIQQATILQYRQTAGDKGKKRLTLRGDVRVEPLPNASGFWRCDPANRELLMSAYHLSPATSRLYIDKILDFRPAILSCDPAMGYLLAKFFKQAGINYCFEAIFTSSETLTAFVRNEIEAVFKARVQDWYGQAERVAVIHQCPQGRYHIQENYSLVELIENPDSGGFLEVTGTQLYNRVMPLLRYRTGDYVQAREQDSALCECGSAFRTVEKIFGRPYSYLLPPTGAAIAITTQMLTESTPRSSFQENATQHNWMRGNSNLQLSETNGLCHQAADARRVGEEVE